MVNAEGLGDTGYAYMIDKAGLVMAHPNADHILKENFLNSDNQNLAHIMEIQSNVDNVVDEMDRTKTIVDEQEKAAEKTALAFTSIMKAVKAVSDNIQKVVMACDGLNEKSNIVGEHVENIASITEENAASTEEVAASTHEQAATIEQILSSAQQLAQVSKELQTAIERFKI